jgi:hypothetical protein
VYGPLIDWSIVLYRVKFSVLLFNGEEACLVGAFQWLDGASLGVLHYEVVQFFLFGLR